MKIFVETPPKKIVKLLECGHKGVALMFRFKIFLSGFRPKYLPGIGGYHVT